MEENKDGYKIVVQGEASESDDDDASSNSGPGPKGVVVPGEASESEEEEEAGNASEESSTPQKVEGEKKADKPEEPIEIPTLITTRMMEERVLLKAKYDTLLHRKLSEKNLAFHTHLVDVASAAYLSAAKGIHTTTSQLLKSHTAIQDVSHHMRLLTNDLFHLEDKIDIIATCSLLPDIHIGSG